MSYVDEVLERVKAKNASEPEFLQAVEEVLESLKPAIEANEEKYRKEINCHCDSFFPQIPDPESHLPSPIM